MTEIRVEKKKSNTWIWVVLGLIVLALILWWAFGAGNDDEGVYEQEPVSMQPATEAEPVQWASLGVERPEIALEPAPSGPPLA
jgi:hypothetical protein